MNSLTIGAGIYLAGALAVAVRFAWHMAYRLDHFDWRYGDVWPNFWFSVLLWPLLLKKPQLLIFPSFRSAPGGIDLAQRERELDCLRKNPPPCGNLVRFAQKQQHDADCGFVFQAEIVEHALSGPLANQSGAYGEVEEDILHWVNRRDVGGKGVTDVPAAWWQFQYLAANLIEQGHGVAHCGACGRSSPAGMIAKNSMRGAGHTFHQWNCPCGSPLLFVDGGHVMVRQSAR